MPIKKVLVIVGFSLVFSSVTSAQFSAGFTGGYSYNHLSTDISNSLYTRNKSQGGYSLGLTCYYAFSEMISLQSGAGLIQKNYSFKRTGKYTGIYETFTNGYIQVPFTVQFKIFEEKKVTVFLNAGIYCAYQAYSKVKGTTPGIFNSVDSVTTDGQIIQYLSFVNYSEDYHFNNKRDNRLEFGFGMGAEIHYALSRKYSVLIQSVYFQSVTDQQRKYMINQRTRINQTFSLSMGCMIRFGDKSVRQ